VRYNCAVTGWFQHVIVDPGKLRLFCFLVSFIVAFLFIRFSVRMIRAEVKWWPGNVTPGGTHVHHMVFGLVFMCIGSVTGLAVQNPRSVWAAVTASVLGVGAGLVLDEFALVLHLEDVYWSEQGRLSVQVVFIAIAASGLALLGLSPFGLATGDETPLSLALILLFNLTFTIVCMLKGKVWFGLLGIYITVFALVGAIRLARPDSVWARSRYREGSKKLAKAAVRERRYGRPATAVMAWIEDMVAGRPDKHDERPELLCRRRWAVQASGQWGPRYGSGLARAQASSAFARAGACAPPAGSFLFRTKTRIRSRSPAKSATFSVTTALPRARAVAATCASSVACSPMSRTWTASRR